MTITATILVCRIASVKPVTNVRAAAART